MPRLKSGIQSGKRFGMPRLKSGIQSGFGRQTSVWENTKYMFKSFYPPHSYQDKTLYFITARCLDHSKILITDVHKEIFWKVLIEMSERLKICLYAWTINVDHYHIMILNYIDLPNFMKNIHGKSSYLLNKLDNISGRRVWVNYWDRCIRSEKDFYTRLNYIHHNPVKHRYVSKMEDYKWSSYNYYNEKFGSQWVSDCFETYPVIDFTLECPD